MRIETIYFILTGFIFWTFGCNNNGQGKTLKNDSTMTAHQKITIDTTSGFGDIYLPIINDFSTDSYHIYICEGLFNNKTVGIKFGVKNGIPKGLPLANKKDNTGFVRNAVIIKSIGNESDELIKLLSILYHSPTSLSFTNKAIHTTAFSLNETNVDFSEKQHYKFKLFLEENSDENYAEIYFNLDLSGRRIGLVEKDVQYRVNLINVMTK